MTTDFTAKARQILTISKKIFCILIFTITLAGCGSSAENLYETAELEFIQTNYPHATKLYEEIIEKYPDSKYAETAKKRLQDIKEIKQ